MRAQELERTGCADPLGRVEVLHTDPVIVALVLCRVDTAALGPRPELATLGARRVAALRAPPDGDRVDRRHD